MVGRPRRATSNHRLEHDENNAAVSPCRALKGSCFSCCWLLSPKDILEKMVLRALDRESNQDPWVPGHTSQGWETALCRGCH